MIIQYIQMSTHFLGYFLDVILSPSDLDCASHVRVGGFISDHTLMKCKLDFSSLLVTK